jgi:hypothetical protein
LQFRPLWSLSPGTTCLGWNSLCPSTEGLLVPDIIQWNAATTMLQPLYCRTWLICQEILFYSPSPGPMYCCVVLDICSVIGIACCYALIHTSSVVFLLFVSPPQPGAVAAVAGCFASSYAIGNKTPWGNPPTISLMVPQFSPWDHRRL